MDEKWVKKLRLATVSIRKVGAKPSSAPRIKGKPARMKVRHTNPLEIKAIT